MNYEECISDIEIAKAELKNIRLYPDNIAAELYCIEESVNYGTDMEITEDEPLMTMGMMAFQTGKPVGQQDTGKQETDMVNPAKFCTSCGAKFTDSQKFCSECGSKRVPL